VEALTACRCKQMSDTENEEPEPHPGSASTSRSRTSRFRLAGCWICLTASMALPLLRPYLLLSRTLQGLQAHPTLVAANDGAGFEQVLLKRHLPDFSRMALQVPIPFAPPFSDRLIGHL
jgi:hypothetical protein